jgi:LysR family transcriptional regulator, transcriptional activator of nhaA
MKWMNLHHLKYFLVIAEEGSLSGASKKLLVGQPALSSQLKQFEDWLGNQLFEREGKRLRITPFGEYVMKYAKAIKDLEDELLFNLPHADEIAKRELILGAQESVPKSILAEAMTKILQVPSVKLKVVEGTGDELFQLLIAGKIDLFIGNFRPMNERKEMMYVSLGKEEVSVWGSKNFLSLKKNYPKSLDGIPFILPGFQNPVRHDFEKYMLQLGLSFQVCIEAQDTALQKELASRADGLVVLGDESAKAWVKAGRLFKIGNLPGIKEEYWLGMAKKAIDNERIKQIIALF